MLLVGVGMVVYGLMVSPEALTDDGYPLNNFLYIMGACFIVFPLLGVSTVYYYYKRINDRETFLMNDGLRERLRF